MLLLFFLFLAVVIYALIDCAVTKKEDAKHLPKVAWIVLIVLFPLLGSVGWLLAGRNRRRPGAPGGDGGPVRRSTWVAPDDNPDFLKKLGDENAKSAGGDGDGSADGDDEGRGEGGPRR